MNTILILTSVVLYIILIGTAVFFDLKSSFDLIMLVLFPSVMYGCLIFYITNRHRLRRLKKKNPPPKQTLPVSIACRILGVSESATTDDVKRAHMALIQVIHPDRGGPAHLATLLNEAKTVLCAHLSSRGHYD